MSDLTNGHVHVWSSLPLLESVCHTWVNLKTNVHSKISKMNTVILYFRNSSKSIIQKFSIARIKSFEQMPIKSLKFPSFISAVTDAYSILITENNWQRKIINITNFKLPENHIYSGKLIAFGCIHKLHLTHYACCWCSRPWKRHKHKFVY